MLLDVLLGLLAFLGTVLSLILIHELGHYVIGRSLGVHAERFSLGLGRPLLSRTDQRGTEWRVAPIPLGGYVAFRPYGPGSFAAAGPWRRAGIAAAGPITNMTAALVLFASVNLVFGSLVHPPVVAEVVVGSAAEAAGLLPGDRVVSIEGREIERNADIGFVLSRSTADALSLVVARADVQMTLLVRPTIYEEVDRWGAKRTRRILGIRSFNPELQPAAALHRRSRGLLFLRRVECCPS